MHNKAQAYGSQGEHSKIQLRKFSSELKAKVQYHKSTIGEYQINHSIFKLALAPPLTARFSNSNIPLLLFVGSIAQPLAQDDGGRRLVMCFYPMNPSPVSL